MTDIPTVRRRRDGSIDTEHYIETAKYRRSAAAYEMASKVTKKTRRVQVELNALLASPFLTVKGRDA